MRCRIRLSAAALAVCCAIAGMSAAAIAATTTTTKAQLGSRLVNRFFRELQHHNVVGLRHFLSPAFQIQRANGTRLTKAEYLHKLPNVVSYKLRRLHTTATERAVVVTYEARTEEMVEGKKVESNYAPRLSAFFHTRHGWRLVAHANFNPPA